MGEPLERGAALATSVRCVVPDDLARALAGPSTLERAAAPTIEPSDADAATAARLAAVAPLSTPARYVKAEVVGRGGMGVVHRVIDVALQRDAAMKTMEGPLAARPAHVLRFLEEAQITGQLDHPSVVPVHDVGLVDGGAGAYFTMKLVRGETLEDRIVDFHTRGRDQRDLEALLGAFLRVCDGVGFAHERRVLHRDLKPANVLVGKHGEVYVMDWGLALVLDGGRPSERVAPSGPPRIEGTPQCMAPEQAWGNLADLDERTDVFGLGGVLYAILTGRPPFGGSSAAVAIQLARVGEVKPPSEVVRWKVAPELERITMKALAAAPADRYPAVAALADDVRDVLRGGGWFETRRYPAGAVIVREGDAGTDAFVITEGRCAVSKQQDGVDLRLRTLGPGEVFGETAVFTAKPRTATVTAIEPVTVRVVSRDSLDRELDRSPWLGAFVRGLAERFREHDERLGAQGA